MTTYDLRELLMIPRVVKAMQGEQMQSMRTENNPQRRATQETSEQLKRTEDDLTGTREEEIDNNV